LAHGGHAAHIEKEFFHCDHQICTRVNLDLTAMHISEVILAPVWSDDALKLMAGRTASSYQNTQTNPTMNKSSKA
jgi:hypothetical protein